MKIKRDSSTILPIILFILFNQTFEIDIHFTECSDEIKSLCKNNYGCVLQTDYSYKLQANQSSSMCLCKAGFYGKFCEFRNYTAEYLSQNLNIKCFNATCEEYRKVDEERLAMVKVSYLIFNEVFRFHDKLEALNNYRPSFIDYASSLMSLSQCYIYKQKIIALQKHLYVINRILEDYPQEIPLFF